MSKWNQMKRFGYPPKTMKGVPRPKTWADFHKAYLSNQIYLFNLKSFTIQWAKRGSGNAGARYFNYYLIPPLVYWNPDIRFNRYKVLSASPPFIKLEMSKLNRMFKHINRKCNEFFLFQRYAIGFGPYHLSGRYYS